MEPQPDKRIMVPMRSSLKDLTFGKLLQGMNPTIVGKFYSFYLLFRKKAEVYIFDQESVERSKNWVTSYS